MAGSEGDPSDPHNLLVSRIVHGLAALALVNQLASLIPSEPQEHAERLEAILDCALPLFKDAGTGDGKG